MRGLGHAKNVDLDQETAKKEIKTSIGPPNTVAGVDHMNEEKDQSLVIVEDKEITTRDMINIEIDLDKKSGKERRRRRDGRACAIFPGSIERS